MNIVAVIVTIDETVRPFDDTVADLRAHGLTDILENRLLGVASGKLNQTSIPELAALPGVVEIEIDENWEGAK